VSGGVALVLSGGGAFAAYEVGVVRALVEGCSPALGRVPLVPQVITGTSAGAYNAALLASRSHLPPREAVAEVARVWLEDVAGGPCGNGVFRWRASPFNFLDFKCLLDEPLQFFWERMEDVSTAFDVVRRWSTALLRRPHVEDEEQRLLEVANLSTFISTHPFPGLIRRSVDFDALRRGPVQVRCIATDWSTGELRVFENAELTPSRGPLIVMASSSIPGMFSPVAIPPSWFVDGGVLMNTPLAPAIRAGATELHVIYLDPEIRRIPLDDRETTLGTLQRTLAIGMAGIMRRDVEVAQRINRGLELLRGVRSGALGEDRGDLFQVIDQVEEKLQTGRPYRLLTIHRYHPRDLLGGPLGLLRFERGFARMLMERGYRDVLEHDCEEAGCVLPARGTEAPAGQARRSPATATSVEESAHV
jgi:NTE family protein